MKLIVLVITLHFVDLQLTCVFNDVDNTESPLFLLFHTGFGSGLKCCFHFLGIWQRYGELSKQRLDRAILVFFQNFRKSYVGDQAMHSSKVQKDSSFSFQKVSCFSYIIRDFYCLLQQLYARLSELLGLHDHLLLLNVIVSKIATNLKSYAEVRVYRCFFFIILRTQIYVFMFVCCRVRKSLITR